MKKFLSLLFVTFTCVSLSVSSFATTNLTDVKGTKYETAVRNLVTFNIVNGYEDKTFKPEGNVTRAELSKMLVLAMGEEENVEAAKKKYLDFSDVLSSHWAYGYIKVASDNKLVNGYTDGTFLPQGNVTYAEATAMVIRALGYEEEIKRSNLSWPNNYMVYADEKLDLYKSISGFKAADKATRGDIAILIWNALRTGVCEIVGENNKGLVYGEGEPMISEYLGYEYVENAKITDIEFNDEENIAEVTFKEDKKYKTYDFKPEEALDMFGKTVSILFDKKTGKVLDLVQISEYKEVKGEVSNITESKIYLMNKNVAYTIPDEEDILLYGINSLSEAAEITLGLDGTKVMYCIATGATNVEVAIVYNDKIEIDDDQTGIRVRKIDATKGGSDYVVGNEAMWPKEDEIILYYINSDDFLIVLDRITASDAKEILSVSNDTLKISKNNVYDLEENDDYFLGFVKGSKFRTKKITEIDVSEDKVATVEYNGQLYIIVFEGAILENLPEELLTALEALEMAIEDAENLDESKYTQKSFAKLMSKVEAAKEIDHTYSYQQITRTTTNINSGIEGLVRVTKSTEKKIVAAKQTLRETTRLDDVEYALENEDLYTSLTYDRFIRAYDKAIEVLAREDAVLTDVESALENLENTLDRLKKL